MYFLAAALTALAIAASATKSWPQKYFNDPPPENDWRTKYAIVCQPDKIDPADTALAYQMIRDWCDKFKPVPAGGIKIFRSTNVQAFVCSWGGENMCSSKEFSYFDHWSQNTSVCLQDGRSWIGQHPYWKKAWGVIPRQIDPMGIPNLCRGESFIVDLDVADVGPHEKTDAQLAKEKEDMESGDGEIDTGADADDYDMWDIDPQ